MSKVYAIDGITPVAALAFVKAEDSIPARSLEPDRKSIEIPGSVPLSQLKKKHA